MTSVAEAAKYFKEARGYNRLFHRFAERYKRLQRIGGKIKLEKVTPEEIKAIEGVIGKQIKPVSGDVEVSLSEFEREFQKLRFGKIALIEVLEMYFGTTIRTHKEEKDLFEEEKACHFEEIFSQNQGEYASIIYAKIQQKVAGTIQVHTLYQKNKELLLNILPSLFEAVNSLPLKEPKRLPLFSTQITDNPHFFDMDTEAGRLLVSFLQILLEVEGVKGYEPQPNAEEITEILNYYGIWRDDVLNFVTCFGIRGFKENGEPFRLLDAAIEERTFYNLPLRDVFRLKRIEANFNKVFVVENSSLYSSLIDMFEGEKELPAIICTHGQMKLSAVKLFGKLAETADVIFYSGDHDPDGLSIAQNLVRRFGNKVTLWRFDEKSYLARLSNVYIKSEKKLENINEGQLLDIKKLILQYKKAGYQEKLIEKYIEDIKYNIKLPAKE